MSPEVQPVGGSRADTAFAGAGPGALWGLMARRSTWTQIGCDRELRQRQNERVTRVHEQVRESLRPTPRGRQADDRKAKAREKERIKPERRAGLAEADDQNDALRRRRRPPDVNTDVGPTA